MARSILTRRPSSWPLACAVAFDSWSRAVVTRLKAPIWIAHFSSKTVISSAAAVTVARGFDPAPPPLTTLMPLTGAGFFTNAGFGADVITSATWTDFGFGFDCGFVCGEPNAISAGLYAGRGTLDGLAFSILAKLRSSNDAICLSRLLPYGLQKRHPQAGDCRVWLRQPD